MTHGYHYVRITADFPDCRKIFRISLRCQCNNAYDISILLHKCSIRLQNVLRILSALFTLTDKWTFCMAAQNSTSFPSLTFFLEFATYFQRLADHLHIYGHGCWQITGNTVSKKSFGNSSDTFFCTIASILSQITMNMQIYQTRCYISPLGINHFCFTWNLIHRYYSLKYIRKQKCHTFYNSIFKNNFSIDNSLHFKPPHDKARRSFPSSGF